MFRFVYQQMIRSSFSKHGLAAYALHHKKGVRDLPKMIGKNLGWKQLKSFFFFFGGTQIFLFVSLICIVTLMKATHSWLDTQPIISSLFDRIPITFTDFNKAIAWLLAVNVFWSLFVGLNH